MSSDVSIKIWVDADACPGVIKDILFRAAERTRIMTTLVANQIIKVPPSSFIRFVQVASGFDVADKYILDALQPDDLVVTADIPLAAGAIERNAQALNPRGEIYTKENIRERLSLRDFMQELRGSGVATGGPPTIGPRDRQAFANGLDMLLRKQIAKASRGVR